MSRPAAAVALLLAAFVAPAHSAETWSRIDTDHFTLFTDAAPSVARRFGRDLERLREVLRRTTRGMDPGEERPSYVYVFRDARSFGPYDAVPPGSTRQVAGYFVASRDGTYIALDASAGDRGQQVVYHEYMHQVLGDGVRNVPLWLNEGLAELYSTFRVSKRRAEIGHPIPSHVETLVTGGPLSPLDLFDVDAASPEYHEGARQGRFYASAWAMTHYLMLGADDGLRRFGRYLQAVDAGEDPRRSLLTIYGTDATGLHTGYLGHIGQGLDEFLWMSFDEPIRVGEDDRQRLDRAETLYRLGDLLGHLPSDSLGAARKHLQASIEIRPEHAGAWRALARVAVREGVPTAAKVAYAQAAVLTPNDPGLLAEFGAVVLRIAGEGMEAGSRASRTDPGVLEARKLFERALAVEPNELEALAGLGGTYVLGVDDPAPGIDALTRANHDAPDRVDILHDLIVLLAQDDRVAEARSLYERGLQLRFDDPVAEKSAGEAIRRAEALRVTRMMEAYERAMDRYRRGDTDAAIDVLEWLLAAGPPEAMRPTIEEALDQARAQSTGTE